MNKKSYSFDLETFKNMFQICPKFLGHKFIDPTFEEEILLFMSDLGYPWTSSPSLRSKLNFYLKPWRAFEQFINNVRRLSLSNQKIRCSKGNKDMYYPDSTQKVIINLFMSQGSINPRRNKNLKAYKTTMLFASGMAIPKPNMYVVPTRRRLKCLPKAFFRYKEIKASAKKSSDEEDDDVVMSDDADDNDDQDDDDTDNEDDDDQNDDQNDDNADNESDDDQDDDQNDDDDLLSDDEAYDDENQGANVEGDELDKEETNEENEANELYRDVNVNLEGRDTEMIDAPHTIVQTTHSIEDTLHVIIDSKSFLEALDDALVPREQRLRIGNSNYRLSTTFKPKEPTFQVALDVLSLTPFYQAFLITASVPAIYMHEFWATVTFQKHNIKFKMNKKSYSFDLETFRNMFQICPKVPSHKFVDPPFEEEILVFMSDLGYPSNIKLLSEVKVKIIPQPWRTFRTIINKCLSGKVTRLDLLRLSRAQILWGMYHQKNVDYVYLLWEDLVYQIENKVSKRNKDMYYPRFTKVIINHFMSQDQSIPRRNKVDWHMASDDLILTAMRFILQHEVVQKYGSILPDNLTTQAMKESKAYKTYYAFATGKEIPKPKYIPKPPTPDSDWNKTLPAAYGPVQPWLSTLAQKEDSHDSFDELMDTSLDFSAFVMNRLKVDTLTPKLLAGLTFELMKGSCKSLADDQNDDNANNESDNDQDDDQNDDDDHVHPKLSTFDEKERQDEEDKEEEWSDDEAYDDENQGANVKGEELDEEETNEEDERNEITGISTSLVDVSVTAIAEPPLLSATTLPPPPTPRITHLQQTPVPTPTTVPSSSLQDLPNFGSLFGFDHRLKDLENDFSEFKQTNQLVKAVSSIPGIVDNYLASKLKDAVDVAVQLQSNKLREEAQAENDEFINKIDSNIKTIIKDQVKGQVSKILPKIKQYVTESLGAEVLVRSTNKPQTSYVVTTSLSELELKKILIDKMEENKSINRSEVQRNLYNALIKSYNSDKDIFASYGDVVTLKRRRDDQDEDKDEEPFAGSNRGSKRRRAGKEPESTRVTEDHLDEETSQLPDWFQKPAKPPTPDHDWNKTLSDAHGPVQPWLSSLAQMEDPQLLAGPTFKLMKGSCKSLVELEYFFEEVYKATTDQLDWNNPKGLQYPHDLRKPLQLIPNSRGRRVIPFDHFINNNLTYLSGGVSSRKYTTSVTKTKVADYGHIKWIEDLVPNRMWSQVPVSYKKHALWGISHWGRKRQQFYGFAVNREYAQDHLDWITVRRDDDKLYKFKEGDFKRLRIQDIEDMLLLLVHGKLTNLTVEECLAFNVSLQMFTRSIV
ncbi:hypothetical protein Tco_0929664, partial [Tanacetum coccineum]